MLAITVRHEEKRSTASQYENVHLGVSIEAGNLELHSTAEILERTRQLFALAKASVEKQFADLAVSAPTTPVANDAPSGNGHNGTNGNGGQRTYGRPQPEPTDKQKRLLNQIARDRHLGAESVREIFERIAGRPIAACDRRDFSKVLDVLVHGEAA